MISAKTQIVSLASDVNTQIEKDIIPMTQQKSRIYSSLPNSAEPGSKVLSLSLFMFWIFANDSDCAFAFNDFAFFADRLN